MSNITNFRAVAEKAWELLADLETRCGIPVEDVKFARRVAGTPSILAYLDERGIPVADLLAGMETLATLLGVELTTCKPYRTITQPSGHAVTISADTAVDSAPLLVRLILDADVYATAIIARELPEVAADAGH